MALIKCTECGKEFSDKASACPNCGCPTSEMNINPKEDESPADDLSAIWKTVLSKVSAPAAPAKPHVTQKVSAVKIDEANQNQ